MDIIALVKADIEERIARGLATQRKVMALTEEQLRALALEVGELREEKLEVGLIDELLNNEEEIVARLPYASVIIETIDPQYSDQREVFTDRLWEVTKATVIANYGEDTHRYQSYYIRVLRVLDGYIWANCLEIGFTPEQIALLKAPVLRILGRVLE
jgi:hypothetical protein